MKRLLTVTFLLPTFVGAQEFGTKKDILVATGGAASAGPGLMPFIQMMVALGIVLCVLKFALPKLMSKMSKKLVTNLNGGIQIEDSANFAGGNLYVVKARTKTLLLSVSQTGVTCLANLTDNQAPVVEPNSFEAVLAQEQKKPEPVFAAAHVEDEAPVATPLSAEDIELALRRLQRLAG